MDLHIGAEFPAAGGGKPRRQFCRSSLNTAAPISGAAARVKLGRVPLRVSAASVNCGTSRVRAPRPAGSGSCGRRHPEIRGSQQALAIRRASASVSLGWTAASTSSPRPIAAICRPFTVTPASLTRCNNAITCRRPVCVSPRLTIAARLCIQAANWRRPGRLQAWQSGGLNGAGPALCVLPGTADRIAGSAVWPGRERPRSDDRGHCHQDRLFHKHRMSAIIANNMPLLPKIRSVFVLK